MKLFKWIKGRMTALGAESYEKLCFAYFRIGKYGFDAYILSQPKNLEIPWHKDEVADGKHYRLNFNLSGSSIVFFDDYPASSYGTAHVLSGFGSTLKFRPDLISHKVKVLSKSYKLSFGFVKFK